MSKRATDAEGRELRGLRIVSDGTVTGTRVYDADGKEVTASLHIRSIRWSHKAGGIPTAELSCLLSEIEIDDIDAKLDERWLDISTLGKDSREYEDIETIRTREADAACAANAQSAAAEKAV